MRSIIVIFLFTSFVTMAQQPDSVSLTMMDTTFLEKTKDTVHSPRKAAILSLIPGAGQVYNHIAMPKGKKKAFWKVPLIYAGLGYTGYKAIENNLLQKELKAEYTYRIDNGTNNLEKYATYDDQGVLTLFEDTRRSRDLMIFAFIAVYGLNILDAHVEAHFVRFDISRDLSLNIRPSMQDFRTPGLAINLNFR